MSRDNTDMCWCYQHARAVKGASNRPLGLTGDVHYSARVHSSTFNTWGDVTREIPSWQTDEKEHRPPAREGQTEAPAPVFSESARNVIESDDYDFVSQLSASPFTSSLYVSV